MTDDGFAPPPALGDTPGPTGRGRDTAPVLSGRGAPGAGRRRRPRPGPLLAWTVGAAAALAILGGVIADLMLEREARSAEPVARGTTGEIAGVRTVAGLCLADAVDAAATVGRVTAVPCDAPHHAETVAQTSIAGEGWPGDEAVAADALDFCGPRVARLSIPSGVAGLEWRAWVPSRDTWEAGDRTAVCVVSSPTPLTGSLEAGTAAPA